MLITCPECSKNISDKAVMCPNCGYPMKDFVTEAKKYKMDEYALKRIVGHSIKDITERVYTERDTKWLQEEIEKIKLE